MSPTPGARIADRYVVLDVAGRGSSSDVWRARDERGGREVALKVPNSVGDPNSAARLRREADLLVRLGPHPHLVELIEVVEHDGAPMLVQEWATGGSLADRLAGAGGTGVGLAETLHVGTAVADALAFAHRNGVLHRDLKPSNVLFDGDLVKLADFSLFAALRPDTGRTMTGAISGSIGYMAPEQFVGVGESVQSDVFGLGAVLYECLYGDLPYEGRSLAGQLRGRLTPVDVPPSPLAGVLRRCLEPDPSNRFATADEVLQALLLASLPQNPTGPADPLPRPWGPEQQASNGRHSPRPPGRPLGPRPRATPPALPAAPAGYCALPGCGATIEDVPGRPPRRYCGPEHRKAARRARHAGKVVEEATPTTDHPAMAGQPPIAPRPGRPRRWMVGLAVLATASLLLAGAATVAGWLPAQALLGALTLLLAVGIIRLFRRLADRATGENEPDAGLLARLEQGDDLTRSMIVQVDELVARLKAPAAKFNGLVVIATIKEYEKADDPSKRAELLEKALTTMDKLVGELSPWYVRHKDAITAVIAVIGAAVSIATAVQGFLR